VDKKEELLDLHVQHVAHQAIISHTRYDQVFSDVHNELLTNLQAAAVARDNGAAHCTTQQAQEAFLFQTPTANLARFNPSQYQ
jgi:hypothetical protein